MQCGVDDAVRRPGPTTCVIAVYILASACAPAVSGRSGHDLRAFTWSYAGSGGGDEPRVVWVEAGDTLVVDTSATAPIAVVVRSRHGVVARDRGFHLRVQYRARDTGPLEVAVHPVEPTGLAAPAPSVRVMVAVERPGGEPTPGGGTGLLASRQHLLLNVFGVAPDRLGADTVASLARALDTLELLGRGDREVRPGFAVVRQEHGSDGVHATARYELRGQREVLTLETRFDRRSGSLACELSLHTAWGASVTGTLTHRVPTHDQMLSQLPDDPVGDYLASDPTGHGPPDDFADLVVGSRPRRSREGVGSFVEGALVGDASGNHSWSAAGGQTALGLVPILGQVADLRDIAAAVSNLAHGGEGGWLQLGVAVIAVVPGLDFLKGGTRATRAELAEASERALDRATRRSLRRSVRRLSSQAARRAAGELRVLAAGRVEIVKRLDVLLVSGGLGDAIENSLRSARNAVKDHLQPSDLAGALRDALGVPVRRQGSGKAWDHLTEVKEAVESLRNAKDNLIRARYRLEPGSRAYRSLTREMDALDEMARRVQKFLAIR